MASPEIVVLIPESTRKRKGGTSMAEADAIADALPDASHKRLEDLRSEIRAGSAASSVDAARGLLAAYRRYDGNMYRSIPDDAWEKRAANVEVVIASGFRGVVASRDPIPAYVHSMAEPMPPFGKLNRWWHDRGLPDILAAYLRAVRPSTVVDLLSLEYRESVLGYAADLGGIEVQMIDFPGMGRASQPLRGERIAAILKSGRP
ncbi:MAG TPA: peroxide stress protein YaaA [Thermoplasmata archaeon]